MFNSKLSDYILLDKIGSGSFGKVYRVKKKETGDVFAAKISKNPFNEQDTTLLADILSEADIISKLNHPAILNFILFSPYNFKNQPKPVIITEYAPNGSLSDLIDLSRRSLEYCILDDNLKLIIFIGISSAMEYLHSNNIIHRDLKPDNILIDKEFRPKIADFGLSKNISLINAKKTQTGSFKGTPIYMAPEIWNGDNYSESSDVYAFGLIIYETITLKKPFKDFNIYNLAYKIRRGDRPELDDQIPDVYKFLIKRCWSGDPSNRPTFQQIKDELFKNIIDLLKRIDDAYYLDSIKYYNRQNSTLNQHQIEVYIDQIKKHKNNEKVKKKFNFIFTEIHVPRQYLNVFNENSLNLIKEADSGNTEKQFEIARNFIEGLYDFPNDSKIGLEYLKRSMKNGNVNSTIYFIKMLIKGDIIPPNHAKATKLIEEKFKTNESIHSFLLGKLLKKQKKYDEAQKCFEISMNEGNIDAIYETAELFRKGYCQQQNQEEMLKLYREAIDKGNLKAMFQYAIIVNDKELIKLAAEKGCIKAIFYYGIELEKQNNIEESMKYLKKAADGGYTESMHKYALLLQKKDKHNESIRYLIKASNKGCIKSMFEYGKLLIEGGNGIETNKELGLSFIRTAARNEYQDAIAYYFLLDFLVDNFANVSIDNELYSYFNFVLAKGTERTINSIAMILLNYSNNVIYYPYIIQLLKKAIEKGNSEAMVNYANMLQKGHGVEIDIQEAIKYYKMAIEKNNYLGLAHYAELLQKGIGVKVDYKKAIEYYKIAIENGISMAMNNYAIMLQNGQGIEVNLQEAIKYYKMAIDCGNSSAMISYALMLQKGQGVEVNFEKALKYYRMAIEKNDTSAMLLCSKMIEQRHGFENDIEDIRKIEDIIENSRNPAAIHLYAFIKLFGTGINRDYEQAHSLLAQNLYIFIPSRTSFAYMIQNTPDVNYRINVINVCSQTYLEAIKRGDSLAITLYARMLQQQGEEIVDLKEVIKYYKMAIEKGSTLAMAYYGRMLQQGRGVDVNYQEAIEFFKKGLNNYEPKAMTYYGLTFQEGLGVDVNYSEAIKYYKMAIERYETEAMIYYARMLQKGQGVSINNLEALSYIIFAIEKGDSEAMNAYALMLQNGEGVYADYKKASEYYVMAISLNNLSAAKNYALMGHYNIPVKYNTHCLKLSENAEDNPTIMYLCATIYQYSSIHNDKNAMEFYKKAIIKGNVESMTAYASILRDTSNNEADYQQAIKLYKRAIDKGDSLAIANYAYMLEHGQGVDIDYQQAIKLYKNAIEKDDSVAMNYFADMLQNGNGIEADYKESQRYYRMAINKGNFEAMNGYADLIHKNQEIEIDFQEAIKYHKYISNYNDARTMYLYASMLQYGKGIEADIQQSIFYYQKAIILKHDKSTIRLAEILQNGVKIEGEFILRIYRLYDGVYVEKNPNAMYLYATLSHHGIILEKNINEAIKLYKKAASKGIKEAQLQLDALLQQESQNESKFGLEMSSSSDDGDLIPVDFFPRSEEKQNQSEDLHSQNDLIKKETIQTEEAKHLCSKGLEISSSSDDGDLIPVDFFHRSEEKQNQNEDLRSQNDLIKKEEIQTEEANHFNLNGFESKFGLEISSSSDDGDLILVDFFHRSEEKQNQSEDLHSQNDQNDLIKKEEIQTEEANHFCLNGFESKFGLEISSSSDDGDLIPVDFFHRSEETKETQNQSEDLHLQNDLIKKEAIQTEEAKHFYLNGFESKFGLEMSSSSNDGDLIPVDFFHRLEETKETQNQDEDFW